VTDALLRDENLGMVLVDLRDCDAWALRRVPTTDWYRLQRLAGKSDMVLAIVTPRAMIPSAQIRIALTGSLSVAQSDAALSEVAKGLECEVLRLRKQETGEFPQMIQAG
jgi:hypothetical protein